MPVGTNGNSIYRPHNTPPGTVCTGDGIGVQIRDNEGNVLFVFGIDDGKIYFGNVYADPNITNINMNPGILDNRIFIDGIEYVRFSYLNVDGMRQELNIRADLFDEMNTMGLDGALAAYLVVLSILDSVPSLIDGTPDFDGDGDRDLHDLSAVLEDMFRDEQSAAIDRGDMANAVIYDRLANTIPDLIGDYGDTADSVTADDNLPASDPTSGENGAGAGDSGWLF